MPYCKEKADALLHGMEFKGLEPGACDFDFPGLEDGSAVGNSAFRLETRSEDACIEKDVWLYTELIDLNGMFSYSFRAFLLLQLTHDDLGKLELDLLGEYLDSLNIGNGELSQKEGARGNSNGDDDTWSTEVRTDGIEFSRKVSTQLDIGTRRGRGAGPRNRVPD